MRKAIIFLSFFLFAGTALAYSANSEADIWFQSHCDGTQTGKRAYACDLRDRLDSVFEINAGLMTAPAFDSGWVDLSTSTVIDVPHTVGGNLDNYYIDFTVKRSSGFLSNHQTAADKIWWEDLEDNNIQVVTNGDVSNLFSHARIRIWQYE